MDYKKGYKIKPKFTNVDGTVIFTDGTNEVQPNQKACEAYGYKYDVDSGTCYAFQNTRLDKKFSADTSIIKGSRNVLEGGVNNTLILGNNNTLEGNNSNCSVSGQGHTVKNGINNGTVVGSYGKILRQGEFVQGGGGSSKVNEPQRSVIQLTCNTTDNTTTNMKVNGITDAFINLQNNSILGLEIFLTRLEIGGSSGTAGLFSYRHIQAVVRVEDDFTTTIITKKNISIGKDGVNGTSNVVDISTGTMSVAVSDRNNVNNIWNATVYLHETQTNITF